MSPSFPTAVTLITDIEGRRDLLVLSFHVIPSDGRFPSEDETDEKGKEEKEELGSSLMTLVTFVRR